MHGHREEEGCQKISFQYPFPIDAQQTYYTCYTFGSQPGEGGGREKHQ